MVLTPDLPLTQASDNSSASKIADFRQTFQSPPHAHGPVPFYWWTGDPLDRDRLAWQLDQLCAKGVRQTIISYPHHPDGSNNPGDPALFSTAWWDLLRWFLTACRERGMTAGFQDYTLVEPILKSIGQATPDMQGGQMSCSAQRISAKSSVHLTAESGSIVIGAWAYPLLNELPDFTSLIDLSATVCDGILEWSAPTGDWFVALVFARIHAFDPLHPNSGRLAIEKLYQPFQRECPSEIGKTLNLFFQDELDFGCRMPFWSNQVLNAFSEIKGYDLCPLLPSLWHEMGPLTEKIRLDFADVVVRQMETCYFKPIFQWHEEHGTLFGHDNCGRGRMAQGRAHYGDYFRAMRWYSAPGCDDPKLQGARAFKGLKVNSSIAHLYQRPRVWVEAFHSSGWGTTPAEVVAAIQEDFAYGATVVNLHGLYYSTHGGWWEWAPPDFHFRQPYWQHAQFLNHWFTRLSWILSQGTHQCDVAIVYPIAALDAQPADPALNGIVAHIGNEALGEEEYENPQPEESAFQLGKYLFDQNCDFDFLDFESLERATPTAQGLHVAGGSYRVMIFPAMAAVHFSSLVKARDFLHSGGVVIAYGCLPKASDHAGHDDPALDALITEIFGSTSDAANLEKLHPCGGRSFFIRKGRDQVMQAIAQSITRDVISTVPLQVLHRHHSCLEVFYLFNPANVPIETELSFRDAGHAEIWNAWTGEICKISTNRSLTFAARESKLLVIHRQTEVAAIVDPPVSGKSSTLQSLEGLWDFEIQPTLNNRFGDFSLPASDALLGPQARRFRYSDAFAAGAELDWTAPEFDDSLWQETTYSFGPRLEFLGPFPPGSDLAAIEQWLIHGGPEPAGLPDWQAYSFSTRWGIERDPFLTDWLSGPHGLKGAIPDEFLDFQSEIPGSVWFLRALIPTTHAQESPFEMGARCAYQAWLNGHKALIQDSSLPPGAYAPWNIPHYECTPRKTTVTLQAGENPLVIKLIQPADQRTRAFFRFTTEKSINPLTLRGFENPSTPRPAIIAPAARSAIRFRLSCPPGCHSARIVTRGPASLWIDSAATHLHLIEVSAEGNHTYECQLPTPARTCALLALSVHAPTDSHAGDALPEPIQFFCSTGQIPLGDWCDHGLACYSGTATYSREFEISDPKSQISLDLGKLSATAEVRLNGSLVATLVAPPWKCDLTPHLVSGKNHLAVTVANTLANHYSVGIPSPYTFNHQTPSGLIGPVTLISHP